MELIGFLKHLTRFDGVEPHFSRLRGDTGERKYFSIEFSLPTPVTKQSKTLKSGCKVTTVLGIPKSEMLDNEITIDLYSRQKENV